MHVVCWCAGVVMRGTDMRLNIYLIKKNRMRVCTFVCACGRPGGGGGGGGGGGVGGEGYGCEINCVLHEPTKS